MNVKWHLVVFAALVGTLAALHPYSWNGFDDTILFRLNWPGDDHIITTGLQEMTVMSANDEEYNCYIPTIKSKSSSMFNNFPMGLTPLELLSPLFTQKVCSYRLESYWTYELCHGRYVRQYHEEREGKKVKIQEYFLGKWDADKTKKLEDAMAKDEKNGGKVKYKKVDGVNLPYFEIEMTDGTMCDLNNKPRTTKMLYVCVTQGKHEVYSFKETSTCEYEVVILSPFLCAHPKYKAPDTSENNIKCVPVGDAPKKPRSMLVMEAQNQKLRMEKMSVNKLGKDVVAVFSVEQVGEDGESRLKVELHPITQDQTDKDEEVAKFVQSTDPAPPLDDTSQVKAFLNGEICLNGGTGWWKYEFCYGKSVVQYHLDNTGSRQSVLLGRYFAGDHLAWINQNPHKKPKPKGPLRTFVSHFYSLGSICDKTGNPRETEVKLKCLENSSSPGQVSLYLLEPKTCQYILSVESPLICDILDMADDNGIIHDMNTEPEDGVTAQEGQNSDENSFDYDTTNIDDIIPTV